MKLFSNSKEVSIPYIKRGIKIIYEIYHVKYIYIYEKKENKKKTHN